ncbi:RNA helicase [Psidium guajava]|nr:RNA helicase [Psidium guajava]
MHPQPRFALLSSTIGIFLPRRGKVRWCWTSAAVSSRLPCGENARGIGNDGGLEAEEASLVIWVAGGGGGKLGALGDEEEERGRVGGGGSMVFGVFLVGLNGDDDDEEKEGMEVGSASCFFLPVGMALKELALRMLRMTLASRRARRRLMHGDINDIKAGFKDQRVDFSCSLRFQRCFNGACQG